MCFNFNATHRNIIDYFEMRISLHMGKRWAFRNFEANRCNVYGNSIESWENLKGTLIVSTFTFLKVTV